MALLQLEKPCVRPSADPLCQFNRHYRADIHVWIFHILKCAVAWFLGHVPHVQRVQRVWIHPETLYCMSTKISLSLSLSTSCHSFLSYHNKTMKGHITHTLWCLFSFIHTYGHKNSCPAHVQNNKIQSWDFSSGVETGLLKHTKKHLYLITYLSFKCLEAIKNKDQYLVCSTSSIVSGRRTFRVSLRSKVDSPAAKANKMKTILGKRPHTSSRRLIMGDTATPIWPKT